MISGYMAGYYTGRFLIKVVKYYVMSKVVKKTFRKVNTIADEHSIDVKNPDVVTKNIFDCLEYID